MNQQHDEDINFSQKELDVLACVLIGKETYKSTGRLLNISPKTVETYIRRSLMRCKCKAKSDLTKYSDTKELEKRYYYLKNMITNTENKSAHRSNFWKMIICLCVILIAATGFYYVMNKEKNLLPI